MTLKKYPQNLHTKKILFFLKTPKNIEIQNLEPKKMTRAYVCFENIRVHPPRASHKSLKLVSLYKYKIDN